jgi:hypothetical protein
MLRIAGLLAVALAAAAAADPDTTGGGYRAAHAERPA